MFGCESWTIKKAEPQRIDAFELWCWRRLLRVPWTARRSNQSILKEISQDWFIGRTDVEAEAPILWSPNVKNWLLGKDPDAGKDGRQEEKGTVDDEMVGCHHHWLDGHEFEQALGVGKGQGSLACCSPQGRKELDTTERLNWVTNNQNYGFSSGHVQMWELDSKEGWAPKNWCFWTVVLEKTPQSPLDCREIKPVKNPKGNQSWVFTGSTNAEAEALILWPLNAKS